jgi:lysophospholipase L1-like esterase
VILRYPRRSARSIAVSFVLALVAGLALQQAAALWLSWYHDAVMYRLRVPVFSYPHRARVEQLTLLEAGQPAPSEVWLGDSLVERMPCAPASSCLNLGIGGDTVLGVLHRIDRHRSLARAKRVHLLAGHNDLGRTCDAPYIAALYARALAAIPRGPRLVCHAVPPVDERATDQRTNAAITELNTHLRGACEREPRARFVDLTPVLRDGAGNLDRALHTGDGVHLNHAGYERWLSALRRALEAGPS